ncbi:carbohydrate esterase family 4 protein [Pseudohyphozyma bogoriensis]|nr:carbohydrate esterase family 4 protein [Pseudohyphozyma bogoriensis]
MHIANAAFFFVLFSVARAAPFVPLKRQAVSSTPSTTVNTNVNATTIPGSGQVITTCTQNGTFAMSFDDGPYTWGAPIAQTLQNHSSVGTFFVNGYNWGCIYDYASDLQERYQAGHLIGSHTWNHDDVTLLTEDAFDEQITLIETALDKILGIKPKYFRPPYGNINDTVTGWLAARGYEVITWNFDSGDSDGATAEESVASYEALYSSFPAPYIPLNHETYATTGDTVVPTVVPELLAAGWKIVTVAECLGDTSPYQYATGVMGVQDSTWTCDGTPAPGLNRRRTFALTFDDGPYTYGYNLGEYLVNNGGHGTFFVNGYNYGCIYDYAEDLQARYQAGHLIGSHTWNHVDITAVSQDELDEQVTLVETALQKILGIKPKYFRPPYGSVDDASVQFLQDRGYTVVNWDFDSGDSAGASAEEQIDNYSSLYGTYPTPHIALNHVMISETYDTTPDSIVSVVPDLLAAGYRLVTVAECLGDDSPYQSVGSFGTRDDSWTCDGTPAP